MALTLSAVELEAELELARQREAIAAKRAAEQARQAAKEAEQAETRARRQLAGVEAELATALAAHPGERPGMDLREIARQFLYGAAVASGPDVLATLIGLEPGCGRLAELHQAAGRLVEVLPDAADDLECACWRALLARVRWLAGEVEP